MVVSIVRIFAQTFDCSQSGSDGKVKVLSVSPLLRKQINLNKSSRFFPTLAPELIQNLKAREINHFGVSPTRATQFFVH